MPIYEYRCNRCGATLSRFIRDSSRLPDVECEHCHSRDLARQFSTFSGGRCNQDVYGDILADESLQKRMLASDPAAMVEWSRRMEGSEIEKGTEYGEAMRELEA